MFFGERFPRRYRNRICNGVCLAPSFLDDPLEIVLLDEEVDLFDELFQVAPDELLRVAFQSHKGVPQQVLLGPRQDHGEDLQEVLGEILRKQGEGVAVCML